MGAPLYQLIVDHYTAAIRQGLIKPGEFLPTQAQIAEEWECSLGPVRHALLLLEHNGLINNMQGKGARVLAQPK